MENVHFVASWSGGKDSALAYYRALKLGMVPKKIVTMFEEDDEISKSHAIPLDVVKAQVDRLGVPLLTKSASWGSYEGQFIDAMDACRAEGITHGVFGDIDLQDHLEWVQKTCAKSDIIAVHPLWNMSRLSVVEELLEAGFESWIIVVNTTMMPASYVGKRLTKEIVEELEAAGIDACGENGEFHTIVVDGPIFSERVPITISSPIERGQYVFSPVSLEEK
ncbi:adenosine nucleotide hydrolase [Lysinibacillus contaminans]|uniref:Adenosine nucleotide hydrolase n=1 Tax=Lysinibacillus contaminans TaxID=1293441 RepID=A0ABR5K2E4_9BACI|nr:diphthine--ammonia ligase [Lysinibacillus contaminans]KOS68896.1 adenosine nucleotide hydrolase [Lysinibacillus contaminans]